MLEVERQQLMLHHIRLHGSGNVADLAQALGVSASTVRRDLADLSGRRLLNRVRGGASAADPQLPELASRMVAQHSQKRLIGAAAADRVANGSTLLIGGGTTTEAMVPFLAGKKQLTVLTNALNVAGLLGNYPEITVVVLGGILRHDQLSLFGPDRRADPGRVPRPAGDLRSLRHRCRSWRLRRERRAGSRPTARC